MDVPSAHLNVQVGVFVRGKVADVGGSNDHWQRSCFERLPELLRQVVGLYGVLKGQRELVLTELQELREGGREGGRMEKEERTST